MDRFTSPLLKLRRELTAWLPHLKKAMSAKAVDIEPTANGEFVVVIKWQDGEYRHHFTKKEVFGTHLTSTRSLRPRKRPCAFSDDILLGALEARKKK